MAVRQFSNVAVETTLSSGIAGGASSLTVVDATGWPAAPFLLVIEPDLANEELILVGAKAGAVFSSLTRGFGGTSDVGHSAGDDIKHVIVGEDLALTYIHIHKPGTDDTAAVTHADILSPGTDDHHPQAHTAASHSDQGATGAELETLTDGSNADALHDHALSGLSGDHGDVGGLGDDDHTQYFTDARHDQAHGAILVERTTNQSIPDNTPTTVVYATIIREDDPGGDFSYATGTGILTINNAGWYHICAGVIWTGGTQNPFMGIYLNGTATRIAIQNCDNGDSKGGVVSIIKYFAATNTVRIIVEQNAGGSANILGSEESFFSAVKLRD